MVIRRKRTVSCKVSSQERSRFVAELRSAINAVESQMPREERDSWFLDDPAAAADTFARLEFDTVPRDCLADTPEGGAALELSALVVAAARRSVEALHRILRDIEGMGYVAGSGVLRDVVDVPDFDLLDDVEKVHQFLEYVITQVLDDTWDIHMAAQNLENATDETARNLCREFATDAADTIVTAIGNLDDSIETESLGNADRSVFTDGVLRRSVALVILGCMHMSVADSYDTYDAAASRAWRVLESTPLDTIHERGPNAGRSLKELKSAFVQLLDAGRDAAADFSAFAALQSSLLPLSDQ